MTAPPPAPAARTAPAAEPSTRLHRAMDGLRRVLSVHRGVRPWVGLVPLVRGADGVLELPVGAIDASATAPGDDLRLG